jgi:hypothetical protein
VPVRWFRRDTNFTGWFYFFFDEECIFFIINAKEWFMNKKNKWALISGVLLVFGVLLSSCTTVESIKRENPVGGDYQTIQVPNKDFESLGLVFAEFTSTGDSAGNERGEVYTYYKLLQEAKNLGADAIVNVVIEANIQGSTEKLLFRELRSWVAKKTWYGSATAIKYTTTINDTKKESLVVLGPDGKALVTEDASSVNTPLAPAEGDNNSFGFFGGGKSGKKWWNPFTWFKK